MAGEVNNAPNPDVSAALDMTSGKIRCLGCARHDKSGCAPFDSLSSLMVDKAGSFSQADFSTTQCSALLRSK